jgi:predicted HTH domain antitoxin
MATRGLLHWFLVTLGGASMKQVVISYPDGLAQAMKLSDREFGQEVSFLAAAKLYELGKLSAGKAAQLAGFDRLTFLTRLGSVGVPAINLRDEEAEAEVAAARELAG